MAEFYGTVSGRAETAASRCGSKRSGIHVSAQSWEGSVQVAMKRDRNDRLVVELSTSDGSNMFGRTLFRGSMAELRGTFRQKHPVDKMELSEYVKRRIELNGNDAVSNELGMLLEKIEG